MRLGRLSVRHFRNLGVQDLAFPHEGAAIVGGNAQGKSNLVEAIYYLEIFRSFRGARDAQMVAFGQDVFRVAGTLVPGDSGAHPVEVAAAYQRTGGRKKVSVDGVEADRLGDALGRLGAVVFSPSDVALVTGPPAERRRFLDVVLSLNVPGYLQALQTYRNALAQRNAALREELAPAAVAAWDVPLTGAGARVVAERCRWLGAWGGAFTEACAFVAEGAGAHLEYLPGFPVDGAEAEAEVQEALRCALADSRERERRQGTTVVGPHRDEVRIRLETGGGPLDARDFGSGGQRRTVALALRLVEAATIREARGHEPVMLLDDLFAELDAGRSERVLALLEREETGQVILTAPKESDVRVRADVLPRWTIRDGRVMP